MNKDNLKEITQIENEINRINNFVKNWFHAPRGIRISPMRRFFKLKIRPYGVLDECDYTLPSELQPKMIKLLREHVETLEQRQKELWEED